MQCIQAAGSFRIREKILPICCSARKIAAFFNEVMDIYEKN